MEESNQPLDSPIDSVQKTGELASKMDRFLGILIDGIAMAVVYYIIEMLAGFVIGYLTTSVYYLVRDALPFTDGQSLGKKVMKTRAVKEDSSAPLTNDYATSVIRNITLIIPLVGLIDAIFIFIDDDSKRLGDKIGKTIVIKED